MLLHTYALKSKGNAILHRFRAELDKQKYKIKPRVKRNLKATATIRRNLLQHGYHIYRHCLFHLQEAMLNSLSRNISRLYRVNTAKFYGEWRNNSTHFNLSLLDGR